MRAGKSLQVRLLREFRAAFRVYFGIGFIGVQASRFRRFIVLYLSLSAAILVAIGFSPDSAMRQILSAFGPTLAGFGLVFLLALLALSWYTRSFEWTADRLSNEEFAHQVSIGRADEHPQVATMPGGSRLKMKLVGQHFAWPAVLEPTIASSVLSNDLLFRAIKGGFDVPKLALRSICRSGDEIELVVGTASFRDINLAHYWGFLPLTDESTDEESARPKSLYALVGSKQRQCMERAKLITEGLADSATLSSFVPNAMGLSAFVRVLNFHGEDWYSRVRSGYVASDAGKECPAVAGLIDALPDFNEPVGEIKVERLLVQEYEDEFLSCLPAQLRPELALSNAELQVLGLVWDPKKNYQPELYVLLTFRNDSLMWDHVAKSRASGLAEERKKWEVFRRSRAELLSTAGDWRSIDVAAIRHFLTPYLEGT